MIILGIYKNHKMIISIIIFVRQLDNLDVYMIYLSINLNFKELIFIEMFFMIIS